MIKFKDSPLKKVTNLPLNKVTNFNQLVQNYCFTVGILISACTHIHKPDSIPTDSAIESTTNLVTTQIEDEVIGCLKHPDPNLTPQAKQSERRKYIEEAIEAARKNHLSEDTARKLTETLANEFYQNQYKIEIQQIRSMLEAHLTLEQIINHLLKLQYPQKAIDEVLNTSKHLSPNENNQDQSARKEAYQLANQIQKPTHKISESPRQELPISLRDNQELTIAPGDNQKYLFFPESYSIEGWENILLNNEPNTTIALQEYAHRAINILNQTLKKHPQIHPFNIIIATNPKFHPISIKQITKNPQVNGVYIGEGVTLSKFNSTLNLETCKGLHVKHIDQLSNNKFKNARIYIHDSDPSQALNYINIILTGNNTLYLNYKDANEIKQILDANVLSHTSNEEIEFKGLAHYGLTRVKRK